MGIEICGTASLDVPSYRLCVDPSPGGHPGSSQGRRAHPGSIGPDRRRYVDGERDCVERGISHPGDCTGHVDFRGDPGGSLRAVDLADCRHICAGSAGRGLAHSCAGAAAAPHDGYPDTPRDQHSRPPTAHAGANGDAHV